MSEAARLPGYRISEDARLDARNTFGVAARAPMLVEVSDASVLPGLMAQSMLRDDALAAWQAQNAKVLQEAQRLMALPFSVGIRK